MLQTLSPLLRTDKTMDKHHGPWKVRTKLTEREENSSSRVVFSDGPWLSIRSNVCDTTATIVAPTSRKNDELRWTKMRETTRRFCYGEILNNIRANGDLTEGRYTVKCLKEDEFCFVVYQRKDCCGTISLYDLIRDRCARYCGGSAAINYWYGNEVIKIQR